MLAVMTAAFMLLGYATGDFVSALIAVPLFTAVIMMVAIFLLVIGVDLLISLLVFSMKTWGKNSDRLRRVSRWIIVTAGDPPDLFFIAMLILASAVAIRMTADILPKALTSPSLAADFALSTTFWLVFNVIGIFAERKE